MACIGFHFRRRYCIQNINIVINKIYLSIFFQLIKESQLSKLLEQISLQNNTESISNRSK